MSEILVSAHRLEKHFASRLLFQKLTFAVTSGARIGLVGPNGAGKSTLLRILAGQEAQDGGDVTFARGLRVGFLQQTPEFVAGTTVFDTVRGGLIDPDDSDKWMVVHEFLSRLELVDGPVSGDSLVDTLSGGWQKRVALARELVREPQLLLLDEPTNHLDVESILWLEEYLANSKMATITVTHDRLFLQRVATEIFDLDRRNPDGLLINRGDYADYLQAKEGLMSAQERQESALKNTLRREVEWLRRGAKARQTKQTARIARAETLQDNVDELQIRNQARKAQLDFQGAERNPQKILEATGVSKGFGGHLLFANLTQLVTPKTRLGLLGPNGCGKSTLIRVLLGEEPADSGEVKPGANVEIAYFEQSRQTLNPAMTTLRTVCPDGDYVNFRGQFIFARSYLSRFLFQSEQMDMPVAKLSGGEQARLRIAQLMLQKANVLVLDEPTNDLDVQTLEVLEQTLSEFTGAVILVSHDRYFLDQVANEILAFPETNSANRELLRFASYSQWENWALAERAQKRSSGKNPKMQTQIDPISAATANTAGNPANQADTKLKRKLSFSEKRELETMEENIGRAESRLKALENDSADPANLSDSGRLTEIYAELAKTQAEIDRLYARWAKLS